MHVHTRPFAVGVVCSQALEQSHILIKAPVLSASLQPLPDSTSPPHTETGLDFSSSLSNPENSSGMDTMATAASSTPPSRLPAAFLATPTPSKTHDDSIESPELTLGGVASQLRKPIPRRWVHVVVREQGVNCVVLV